MEQIIQCDLARNYYSWYRYAKSTHRLYLSLCVVSMHVHGVYDMYIEYTGVESGL